MPSVLESIFQHNLWANERLLEACAGLDEAQLALTVPGTFGSVAATLAHLVATEADLASFIQSGEPAPTAPGAEPTAFPGIDRLKERARASGEALIGAAAALHGEAEIHGALSDEPLPLAAAVYFVQAVNQATELRAHVAVILRHHGLPVPEIDGWAFHEMGGTG
jgi:uncharacterized damage-inducible protein DinB